MDFYEEISPYYDYIFPAGEEQLKLISDIAGEPPKRILDIACGTGAYSVRLAQAGHNVWGMDFDAEMIRLARSKAARNNVQAAFFTGDMLELDKAIGNVGPGSASLGGPGGLGSASPGSTGNKFDCIFCIGNSIVHLGSKDAIRTAVIKMKEQLAPGGSIVLQVINFDRILEKGVTSLPTIANEKAGLVFRRNYTRDEITGLIYFDTVLNVDKKTDPVCLSNRVELFPLTSSILEGILMDAGIDSFAFYGDFNRNSFVPDDSFMLVVVASCQ